MVATRYSDVSCYYHYYYYYYYSYYYYYYYYYQQITFNFNRSKTP